MYTANTYIYRQNTEELYIKTPVDCTNTALHYKHIDLNRTGIAAIRRVFFIRVVSP